MDEQQIAQNLKQNTDEGTDPGPRVDGPSAGRVDEGITLDTYKMMDHFEISPGDRHNQSVIDQLNFVMEFARANTPEGDLLDSLNFVRELESRLGLNFKGDKLFHLYNWVRLDQEARRIEAEKLNHVA